MSPASNVEHWRHKHLFVQKRPRPIEESPNTKRGETKNNDNTIPTSPPKLNHQPTHGWTESLRLRRRRPQGPWPLPPSAAPRGPARRSRPRGSAAARGSPRSSAAAPPRVSARGRSRIRSSEARGWSARASEAVGTSAKPKTDLGKRGGRNPECAKADLMLNNQGVQLRGSGNPMSLPSAFTQNVLQAARCFEGKSGPLNHLFLGLRPQRYPFARNKLASQFFTLASRRNSTGKNTDLTTNSVP